MKIIEAGHYYMAKGPTEWSQVGWNILEKIKCKNDKTLLFVDDIHELFDISLLEKNSFNINFSPKSDFLVLESEMKIFAFEVFSRLEKLHKKSRPRQRGDETIKWHGFNVIDSRGPTCVLSDAGLVLKKSQLGFNKAVNILPFFYKSEQERLLEIVKKVIPEIDLEVVFFNLNGDFWKIKK